MAIKLWAAELERPLTEKEAERLTTLLPPGRRERLLREDIPAEPNDMPVPWVVTEAGLYEDGVPARLQ